MKKTFLSLAACLLMSTAFGQVQVLTDTSLEVSGASNNQVWTSTSTNFGTTWCKVSSCGNGNGPMVPRTGAFYSWFGGGPDAEIGTISQTFTVATAGSAVLKFWWIIPLRDATDIFKVRIDGVDVYTLESNTNIFTVYEQKTVALGNLSAGSHTIQFYSEKTNGHQHNLGLDDVTLDVTSGLRTETIGLSSGISIYTNSADHTIEIHNKTMEKSAEVEIYDATGKLFSKESYNISSNAVLSTIGWNPGIYILKIKTKNGTISKKVLIK